jgi:hypothetical protein
MTGRSLTSKLFSSQLTFLYLRVLFSASQLWKAEYSDEGVCSIALINAEYALGEEDLKLESSLIFAGHFNGQISMLDGHGK